MATEPQCTGCRDSGFDVCGEPCPCARLRAHAAGDQLAADVTALRAFVEARGGTLMLQRAARVFDFLESQTNLVLALADRCKGQSELLSKRAEAVRAGADGTREAA